MTAFARIFSAAVSTAVSTADIHLLATEPFVGGDDNDSVYGGSDSETMYGMGGNDVLSGNDGDDWLYGGDGSDVVAGWAGNDYMEGGDGHDTFLPGNGNDTAYGGAGNDYFTGGLASARSTFWVDLGADNDLFTMNLLTDGTLAGGDGVDTLQLDWADDLVLDAVFTPDGATRGELTLVTSGMEIFRITTGSGHDSVTTADGDDILTLGWGANVGRALGGDDVVSYRLGLANDLDGGEGSDTLIVSQVPWGWGVTFDASGETVLDGFGSVLVGFETFIVNGMGSADHVRLGSGNDAVRGNRGDDSAWGGQGNDLLSGGIDHDFLSGESGNDTLRGGVGDDILLGDAGNDRFFLGLGTDTVSGGSGVDRFFLVGCDGTADLIEDFTSASDQIYLYNAFMGTALPLGRLTAGQLAAEVASGDAGQFVYRTDGADGLLIWDANGAAEGGELSLLRLTGLPALAATDIFILA